MKYQLYFPSRQAEQLAWLRLFRHALATHRAAFQLAASDETRCDAVLRDLDWLIHVMGPLLTRACTALLNELCTGTGSQPVTLPETPSPPPPDVPPVPPGALKRVFRFVKVLKNRPACTGALGHQLGIIGNLHARAPATPEFEIKAVRGAHGQETAQARVCHFGRLYWVENRRGGGDWEPLGDGTHASARFTDTRPLLHPATPEQRDYRLRFFEDDHPAGDWTPVQTVTVSP